AIQAVAAVSRRQISRHDDRSGGNPAVGDRAARAVVDLRALTDEYAHPEHRVLLDDDALDHFRARTDEAIVLDDRRARLHRLEHPADAYAAREMHVLADLRARADRRPGVD